MCQHNFENYSRLTFLPELLDAEKHNFRIVGYFLGIIRILIFNECKQR